MTRTPHLAASLAALLGTALAAQPAPAATMTHQMTAPVIAVSIAPSEALTQAKSSLRDLWIGHVFWVRSVVVARHSANDGAEAAAEAEVVANARALAAAVEPFYGADASEALFKLLAGHYGAVKAYLDATQSRDAAARKSAVTDLLANAERIATFLSGANPFLPHDAVLGLLQVHGGHHLAQIDDLYAGKYAEEAEVWGEMTQHMYVIADAMAGALAQQFPERF